ncbi:MAG: hypothetical protein PUE71_09530 [Clostridia bacterium]|nr:hypothetical protein [Clostridia bacterium]
MEISVKNMTMAYFSHANLCRERHKFEYRSRKSEISGAFLEQKIVLGMGVV